MSNDIFGAFKDLLKESAKVLEQNTSLDFGLTNKNGDSYSSVNVQDKNIVISDLIANDFYNEIIRGRKVRFKLANPTLFRVDTDTGANLRRMQV